MSVQWSTGKDEPYLAHPNYPTLRLTPFRKEDAEEWHRYVNIPEIGKRSRSAPYPSSLEAAAKRVASATEATRPAIDILRASTSVAEVSPISACPFDLIRDGDRIIGRLGCRPFEWDPRNLTIQEMVALPPEEQIWSLGWSLDPAYQGKGIMVSFGKLLINEWIKPYMKVGKLECGIETDNAASMALAKRLGYVLEQKMHVPWDEGETREISVFFMDLRSS